MRDRLLLGRLVVVVVTGALLVTCKRDEPVDLTTTDTGTGQTDTGTGNTDTLSTDTLSTDTLSTDMPIEPMTTDMGGDPGLLVKPEPLAFIGKWRSTLSKDCIQVALFEESREGVVSVGKRTIMLESLHASGKGVEGRSPEGLPIRQCGNPRGASFTATPLGTTDFISIQWTCPPQDGGDAAGEFYNFEHGECPAAETDCSDYGGPDDDTSYGFTGSSNEQCGGCAQRCVPCQAALTCGCTIPLYDSSTAAELCVECIDTCLENTVPGYDG